jgi:hypothetical protein
LVRHAITNRDIDVTALALAAGQLVDAARAVSRDPGRERLIGKVLPLAPRHSPHDQPEGELSRTFICGNSA